MYKLIVSLEDDGKRVDNVSNKHLVSIEPDLEVSRSLVQKLIEEGLILLNKNKVKSSHKVKENDLIEIDMDKLKDECFIDKDRKIPKAEKVKLDIVYEDDDLIVVNKSAGMVVHPACGNYSGTLVNALLNHKTFLTSFNEPRATSDERRTKRPGIVHRLDKDTSGVIIVAKNGPSLRKLAKQLKSRTVTKEYIAVVRGILELDEDMIDLPLSKDKSNRIRMRVDRKEGKEAITYYKVIRRDKENNYTVVSVRPKTGRTHQIRIHFSHIKHPILGDELYNGPKAEGLTRQALHAYSITFIHPSTNKEVTFYADLPKDLAKFCNG